MENTYSVRSTAKAKWRQRQSKISMCKRETENDRRSLIYAYVSAEKRNSPVSVWEKADKIKKKL